MYLQGLLAANTARCHPGNFLVLSVLHLPENQGRRRTVASATSQRFLRRIHRFARTAQLTYIDLERPLNWHGQDMDDWMIGTSNEQQVAAAAFLSDTPPGLRNLQPRTCRVLDATASGFE